LQAQLHVRNLFWIGFMLDKIFGLRTGLQPLFNHVSCDLTLPATEPTAGDPGRVQSPYSRQTSIIFHTLIRLALIQSSIYNGLYSPPALRQSDAELLATIRRLDSALEEWWSSVPTYPTDADHLFHMVNSLFRMQYHYSMSAIHQTSSRCTAWVSNQDTRAAGSSLAISIGASRSVLRIFLETKPQLLGHHLM
jgi:hypothetical protein